MGTNVRVPTVSDDNDRNRDRDGDDDDDERNSVRDSMSMKNSLLFTYFRRRERLMTGRKNAANPLLKL